MNEYMADRCDRIANSCYNAGLKRARERELSAAVPFLKRALLFNKRHTDARNLLGLIFFEIGEVGDALAQWVISTSLDPEDNAAVRYLDEIRRKRGRLKAYSQMITMYNTALAAAQNGNRDFALHRLSGICAEHPNYVRAVLLLAVIHMSRGEFAGAVIQDVTKNEGRREEIAAKAREVIRKNVYTVQEVARLFGEHIAETEIMLNEIAGSYESHTVGKRLREGDSEDYLNG